MNQAPFGGGQSFNSARDIYDEARSRNVIPLLVALERGEERFYRAHINWPDIASEDGAADYYPEIKIVDEATDLLALFARNLGASIQFPQNTAYVHGLGVVSSAMNRTFKYNYYGSDKPVNLYVVTAQPPSTGKSGINSALADPVRIAYAELNKANSAKRGKAQLQVDKLTKELESSKVDAQIEALTNDIHELLKEIEGHPNYTYSVDDSTPEALEQISASQGGMFNIISDESDAISIILGNVYGDGKSKTNYGIFLKGWDGDFHSPARITRKTVAGHVYGSLAVIAQDESIDSILAAGQSGRGISERILIMREANLLGQRDHTTYTPVCGQLKRQYAQMIHNMIMEPGATLKISDDAIKYLQLYRNNVEKKLGDGGEYANTMLRGSIGKADKQIIKIACVLHGIENWQDGGARSLTVTDDTVIKASHIFNELCKMYIGAADSQGFMGINTEIDKLKEMLTASAAKGVRSMTIKKFVDNFKNLVMFKGLTGHTKLLRETYGEILEDAGYCVIYKNDIYINPKLK